MKSAILFCLLALVALQEASGRSNRSDPVRLRRAEQSLLESVAFFQQLDGPAGAKARAYDGLIEAQRDNLASKLRFVSQAAAERQGLANEFGPMRERLVRLMSEHNCAASEEAAGQLCATLANLLAAVPKVGE